jgi:hypothetical protein
MSDPVRQPSSPHDRACANYGREQERAAVCEHVRRLVQGYRKLDGTLAEVDALCALLDDIACGIHVK